jgi:hypothetical protein
VTAFNLSDTRTHGSVRVLAGDVRRHDFRLGPVQPPTVVEQSGPIQVCPGSQAVIGIVAAGEESTMRWRKDGVELDDDDHYAGTTTDCLIVNNVDEVVAGLYTCEVTNGMGSAVSNPIALSLKTTTLVTQQPAPTGVQLHGDAEFRLVAAGTGLTYRWRKDGVALSDGLKISGAKTSILRVLDVTASSLGSYDCVVTGDCGSLICDANPLFLGFAPGDFDADQDVDMEDFGILQICMTSVGVAQTNPACRKVLLDEDTDVDPEDVVRFLRCFAGPGVTPPLDCANWSPAAK